MKPLDGLVLLDLTHMLSGPYGAMMLTDLGMRTIKVEPPGKGLSGVQAATDLCVGQAFAEEHVFVPVRRAGHGLGHLTPRPEAPVGEACLLELEEGRLVGLGPVGLAKDRAVPGHPEPGQVLQYARLEFRPATGAVDVLDAKVEGTARGVCGPPRGEGGKGVSTVEAARRGGGEPEDGVSQPGSSGGPRR